MNNDDEAGPGPAGNLQGRIAALNVPVAAGPRPAGYTREQWAEFRAWHWVAGAGADVAGKRERIAAEFKANPAGGSKVHLRLRRLGVKVNREAVMEYLAGEHLQHARGDQGRDARGKTIRRTLDQRENHEGHPAYIHNAVKPKTMRARAGPIYGRRGPMMPIRADRCNDVWEADLIDDAKLKNKWM